MSPWVEERGAFLIVTVLLWWGESVGIGGGML